MAIMIPDGLDIEWRSRAEKRLFNRLYREIPDNIYVLHSLGITRHPLKMIGEADFVIIAPGGVFVLEIKGGGVSCRDGVWYFADSSGRINRKKESPWSQAASGLAQVRKEIEDDGQLRGLNFGYGVVFPDDVFLENSPEIEQEVLLDQREWHGPLSLFLRRLETFWTEKNQAYYGRAPLFPDARQCQEIRKLLRPDIQSAFTLRSIFNNIESEMIELTEEQKLALRGIERNPRSLVSGGAGTGKTVLVRDRATRLAEQNRNVLVLCYNRLLGEHLQANLQYPGIHAESAHQFFHKIILQAGLTLQLENAKLKLTEDDYYDRAYPDIFMDALTRLDNFNSYDVIVVDELQDLLKGSYLDALDLAITSGLDRGSWHFFLDPNQNIFGSETDRVLSRLRSYGVVEYELTVNCRNSSKVAVNTSVLSGIDVSLVRAVPGGYEKLLYYDNSGQLADRLKAVLSELIDSGVSKKDIIFLSPRTLQNSILAGMKLNHLISDITTGVPAKSAIDFCTMAAFKGLERRVVIAVDLDCIGDLERRLLLYCGLSRAITGLVFCIPSTRKHVHDRLTAEFGARLANIGKS